MIQNSEKVSSEYTLWHVAEPFRSFESAPLTGVPISRISSFDWGAHISSFDWGAHIGVDSKNLNLLSARPVRMSFCQNFTCRTRIIYRWI